MRVRIEIIDSRRCLHVGMEPCRSTTELHGRESSGLVIDTVHMYLDDVAQS
jgi:hypothetical protein